MTARKRRETVGPLQAGAACVDITPREDIHLSGAIGVYRPAKLVADPLSARAIVVQDGQRKLCLVATDLTIMTKRYSDHIRRTAGKELGFDPDAVMVHATQTHSAPSLGHFMLSDEFEGIPEEFDWLRGGDNRYNAFAEERILEAIRLANDSLEPVQVGAASGIEGRFAFNRRAVMRNGKVSMPPRSWKQPLGPTDMRYLEGPIDPEVGVVCFRGRSLRFPAILVNYTCHPVHVFAKPIVSADWPGALASELGAIYGPTCIPIVLNGACGNINPWPPFDPDYVEDHHRMGMALASTVERVVESMAFKPEAALDWRVRRLMIPIRQIDPQELENARKLLKDHPSPAWTGKTPGYAIDQGWAMAANMVDLDNLRQRSPKYEYEIQIFRIGDVALVGLPGEPFVEGGLRIKLASPTFPTYIIHDINHYVGYIPTKEALPRGGHETATGNWSRLVPEALDVIVESATELLRDMFPVPAA